MFQQVAPRARAITQARIWSMHWRAAPVLCGVLCQAAVLSAPTGAYPETEAASTAGRAAARAEIAAICDQVAAQVARESGVPRDVLAAIMLTETGRRMEGRMRAWPWTVNMEGAGHWFDDADSARAFVYDHFRRGARSFDIGCFQINYKWHHTAFDSLEQMFEPLANGRYAARFLSELFAELGNWDRAAGAYHSRTPELAERYAARFARFRAQEAGAETRTDLAALPPRPGSGRPTIPSAETRTNGFPLLRGGSSGALGSLVPAATASTGPIVPFIGQGS